MRDKLIELLTDSETAYSKFVHETSFVPDKSAFIADRLIANGVTIQKWIPASEPPNEEGRYYCNVESFAFPGCFYQEILKYDKYGFHESGIYTDGVTHWMPLPEPPKEVKDGSKNSEGSG